MAQYSSDNMSTREHRKEREKQHMQPHTHTHTYIYIYAYTGTNIQVVLSILFTSRHKLNLLAFHWQRESLLRPPVSLSCQQQIITLGESYNREGEQK